MDEMKPSQRTVTAAYGAAFLFAIHLVTYFIAPIRDVTTSSSVIGAELLALLAVAEHLILFPVIAVLPVPRWARAVGYGWLVLDIATHVMQLNGAAKLTYLSLRYEANIAAALWIASASWQTTGAACHRGNRGSRPCCVFIHCVPSFDLFCPRSFTRLASALVCSRGTLSRTRWPSTGPHFDAV